MNNNSKEITLKLEENTVSLKSKNCKNGMEQLSLLMNGVMRILCEIKSANNLTDIGMEKYYKMLLDDIKNGVSNIFEEVKNERKRKF